MYGFDFFKGSGLSALKDGGKLLRCVVSGNSYNYTLRNTDGVNLQYSYLYLEKFNLKKGSVIAFSDGTIRQTAYYKNMKYGDTKREGLFIQVVSKQPVKDELNIYIFEPYEGGEEDYSDYGLILRDENNKIVYHDNMQTLKILGHFSKKNPAPVWYFPERHIGKKIAYIQVGDDLSSASDGRSYMETASIPEKIYDNNINGYSSIKIHKDILIWYGAFLGKFQDIQKDNDVLYIIIDVTDIPLYDYPADYFPPDITEYG